MKELSLNVLDIAENSLKAGATLIRIRISETEEKMILTVSDNGQGMTEETVCRVTDPFYTTRTTRQVGLGLPFLKLAAEQTGGSLQITSRHIARYPKAHGTEVVACFFKQHLDFTPLGDIVSTIVTLIQGNPNVDFEFQHCLPASAVHLDTRQIRETLGSEISLNEPEILVWITQYLKDQYHICYQKESQ